MLIFGYISEAQSVAYLSGMVYDKESQPLSNTAIYIKGTNYSTYSDVNGKFTITVPAEKTFVLTLEQKPYIITKKVGPYPVGKTIYDKFYFKHSSELGPVTIFKEIGIEEPKISLKPKEIERFVTPGGIERLLPFITGSVGTAGGDLGSGYSVRGGNFDENLIYINGMEVYRPFLVRSGQQEGLSVINPDLVKSLDFSAGGFSAKYGDKLSSVLDIEYKQPDSFASTIQLSLLGANFHVQDKIGKRFTYLVGARFRSNQYLLGTLDVQGEYNPRFYDVQALLAYRLRSNLTLSYFSSIAQNRYNLVPQSRQTSFGNVNNALSLFVAFGGGEVMQYTTFMNGLTLDHKVSNKTNLKWNITSYNTAEREHFTVEGAYRLSELENNLGSDNFAEEKVLLGVGYFIDHARNDLQANVYTATHNGSHRIKRSKIQWGVGYTNESITDKLKEWRYNDSSEYNITTRATGSDNEIVLDEFLKANIALSSFRVNGYVQNTHKLNDRYDLNATYGIRSNFWSFNGENVISPRFQIAWRPHKPFNDTLKNHVFDSLVNSNEDYTLEIYDSIVNRSAKKDWLLRFAGGYYYQPPFYRELRGLDGVINPNLKAQRSIQGVFGASTDFTAWKRPFKFVGEVYYKHMDRMVPYVVDNVRLRYLADNISQGYATGIEGRVNGEFIRGVESWFNMSIMQTKERLYYTDENGDEQLSDWLRRPTDQRVNFSILFQDELPRNPSYKMNLALIYGTKMPFFYDGLNRQKEGFSIPAYRRVDIGFSKVLVDENSTRRPNWLRGAESLWVSLEVFNLLQVNNTISYALFKDFSNTVYGVPNFLTGRRINLRLIMKI